MATAKGHAQRSRPGAMPHGDSSTTFARRSNALISPQPLPREQPGFDLRIVLQPGIARRLDEAFCRAATGNRAPGSRKSTYAQAIRFPASSTWRPFARYSTLRTWLAVRHLDSPFGVSRRPPADAAQPTRGRRESGRRGAAAGALVLHVLDRCPQLLRVPGRPVVALGQPPCPGAPAGGDHPDHRALRAVVLAKGQEPPCQGDRRKFTRTAAARHRGALPVKRGPAHEPVAGFALHRHLPPLRVVSDAHGLNLRRAAARLGFRGIGAFPDLPPLGAPHVPPTYRWAHHPACSLPATA